MPVRRELKFESITRNQIASYLDDRSGETDDAAEIEHEQSALEFLGLIPRGFDLRKTTLALMAEQAAAFYDFDKKALFLADWTPVSMRDTAVIHELAHALADQNYHLGRYSRKVQNSDEKSAARHAVMEGQASYLMLAYAAAEAGQPALSIHPDPAAFDESVAPTGEYPVFDHAPLYLRMSLVFPYTWGTAFQAALVGRLGRQAFAAPFLHPPVSTRQIIHPELYLAGEKLPPLRLPKVPHGYKSIFEGDLGELDHRVLIEQWISLAEAKRRSPAWRGGGFRLIENKRDHRRMLLYESEWSDAESARAFLKVYRKCLAGKSKKLTITAEDATGFAGQTERGYFRVALQDRLVTSTEGSKDPI